MKIVLFFVFVLFVTFVVQIFVRAAAPQASDMNTLAEQYVKLVLSVGLHDADYVDAYYGPPEWRKEIEASKPSLVSIEHQATALAARLSSAPPPAKADSLERLRYQYLTRQIESLRARVAMLQGKGFRFDEESKALYDAVAPTHSDTDFADVLERLGRTLPGDGPLVDRYDAFRSRFVIPKDTLDAVFTAAIGACRTRTLQHITLPPGERFTVEYVTNKSWSGYNWYQGHYRSLIQVNTDLPIFIDRAVDLACHEGYPGHHVYNALLEQHLLRDRGWVEFSVYALFSPQSLIAEGTANFGIEVAFTPAERIAFERTVLFPMAGLDPDSAEGYYDVLALVDRLSYAGNEAARRYLDGQIDRHQAVEWLERYALYSRARAEQRVRFIDQYRSYVINYNLGKDLVAAYVKAHARPDTVASRWKVFAELLSSPRLPSGLKQ